MEIEQGKELVSKTSSQNLVQVSSPTKITGVHYVQVITSSSSSYIITNGIVINFERGQGAVVFHDVFDNENNVGGAQIKVEDSVSKGFVHFSGKNGDSGLEDDYLLSNPYHLIFSPEERTFL
ncbi:hypothetical protein DY000_02007443 [Brassica cretica]|uniref:Uncharacterized protein n=1 Tax=Brassica cretica TaxID=69181 RepID=A0ABQ7CKZ9_BRACR|nr:hypothetical protein DY000_02007443 [Brassica cretica]